MNERDIFDSNPQILVQVLDAGDSNRCEWGEDELGAILWFQLAAPLAVDLAVGDAAGQARLDLHLSAAKPPIRTFGDLLHHPAPPLEVLDMAKEFAKSARTSPGARIPKEVATALYFACIAAGLAVQARWITDLSDAALRQGATWTVERPWVDQETRALVQRILEPMA